VFYGSQEIVVHFGRTAFGLVFLGILVE